MLAKPSISRLRKVNDAGCLNGRYPDYEDLSSFPHGLPRSHPLKGLISPRSLTVAFSRRNRPKDSRAKEATERASIINIMSTIQCGAALRE